MHMRLLANFPFRRLDLLVGPRLHRLPPKKPRLLEKPLLGRVGLLEISVRILYRPDYRRESIAQMRMRMKNN